MADLIFAHSPSGNLLAWKPGISTEWSLVADANVSSEDYIRGLKEFNSKLYAVTGLNSVGRLREWNLEGFWDTKVTIAGEDILCALEIHNSKLYVAGTNGKLYEWDGSDTLTEVAPQLNSQQINCLLSDGSDLYGGTSPNGCLFQWNGSDAWVQVAPLLNSQVDIMDLLLRSATIYGKTQTITGEGRLFQWNGSDAWVQVAPEYAGTGWVFESIVYNGEIYGVTFAEAALVEWNGSDAWVQVAPGSLNAGRGLVIANGSLYCTYSATPGQMALAKWNDIDDWVLEAVPAAQLQGGTHSIVASSTFPFIHLGTISEDIGFSEATPAVHLAGTISEAIDFRDSSDLHKAAIASINEGFGFTDDILCFAYTQYAKHVDRPYVGPIRIAKIELPGKTLYLCDRLWGSDASDECLYEDQLYEPLILNWNNIAVGAIDPINTTVSPASMSFAVGNNTPVGGADSFGELFTAYDPYYAKITITEFFDANPPTDGIEIFEGYIESANVVSGGSVQIACSGFELSISNKFSHEIVDIDTYPNADPNDIGKMLPQVYGSAERVPFRAVDIGAYSTLIADISDIVTTIEVTNADDFASSGTVQIDAEKISYTGKTDNQLTGCTRGAESTTAVTHNAGAYVVKAILVEADYFFYIIGHAVKSITTVYMDNVRQLPENYTAYTGKSGDYHADYNGYSCIMFKNLSSTQTMGTVSADIEGWKDDAAGSYTGTADALIESPEAIIKHILLNRCGLSASAINPSSYTAAKAEYSAIIWDR